MVVCAVLVLFLLAAAGLRPGKVDAEHATAASLVHSTTEHAQTMTLPGSLLFLGGIGGASPQINDDMALAYNGAFADGSDIVARQSGQISLYVVEEGDTLSQVAQLFGVSVNTIVWANELKNGGDIHPGQTLLILPVSGVQHTVEKGDTLASIADKYHGDAGEIALFNRITEDELVVGSVITVPGGEHEMVQHVAVVPQSSSSTGENTRNASAGGFIHPLPGSVKTQGPHGYGGNSLDFGAPVGTPVRAAASGTVIVSKSGGWNGGYGNYVVLDHGDGTQTLYSHLSQNNVWMGQRVGQGETVGLVGNTGRSTGPHLHFEVRGAPNPF
jgi:LysM repeat protein